MNRRRAFVFRARGRVLHLGARTVLMGILNVTPDSFSGDGRLTGRGWERQAVRAALDMVRAGASIIDIGGQSTRPGAVEIPAGEELKRVLPVLRGLAGVRGPLLSVDTFSPEVASAAVQAGAHMVNTVRGTPPDPAMIDLAVKTKAGLLLMHSRGTARTMQQMTRYADVVKDVARALRQAVAACVRAGVSRERLMVDPGLGFAKTAAQNWRLTGAMAAFAACGCPVLAGPSRKSFIGMALGGVPPKDRIFGTAAAVTACVLSGAHVVRVHDVAAMHQVVCTADAVLEGEG